MAEYKPQQEGVLKEGHIPRTEVAILELHRLLAVFLASKSFAGLRTDVTGERDDPISFLQEHEDAEITRILLMLAITARVVDDREERVFDLLGFPVGTLQRNLLESAVVELTLRESCNKIIHAQRIRFDVETNDRGHLYYNPIIYLYGNQSGLDWKATLDIVKFAREYSGLMRHF